MHLAAESHVDRSIDGPGEFIQTNSSALFAAAGRARLLAQLAGKREEPLPLPSYLDRRGFRLARRGRAFREDTPYEPNSPYSASKAGSDHLVRAWRHTYGLPTIVTNCSNNYGPYHFPEKLIPLMILNALEGKPLPVYGNGENVRDWLYVEDHAEALLLVGARGRAGRKLQCRRQQRAAQHRVVQAICDLVDELRPPTAGARARPDRFRHDRPGHDVRYAIDSSKIERELGWRAAQDFETGLRKTVQWYLDNRAWWEAIRSGAYRGERLGVAV